MSNELNGLNPFLYEKILRIIPNLHNFLISHNVLFEYILCLNDYNTPNKSVIPFNYSAIETDPKSVITWSFAWAHGNYMLSNKNIQPVNWDILHNEFYHNCYSYSNMSFSNIKMI